MHMPSPINILAQVASLNTSSVSPILSAEYSLYACALMVLAILSVWMHKMNYDDSGKENGVVHPSYNP